LLFKKDLLAKVLDEKKTQTRRLSKNTYKIGRVYGVTCNRYRKPLAKVRIKNTWSQRIFDVTEEEAKAEGFKNLTEFLERWKKINGYLIPWQTVIAYEFKIVKL